MELSINVNGKTYYKTCKDAFVWTGVLREAPEWVAEMVLEEEAIITKGTRSLTFVSVKQGYPCADIGDLVIYDGKTFNIIRKVSSSN